MPKTTGPSIVLFAATLLLFSCSAWRSRYREQNQLYFSSAEGTRDSIHEIHPGKPPDLGAADARDAGREMFSLRGLDKDLAHEIYCETGIDNPYYVGRHNADGMVLADPRSASTYNLDFSHGTYERTEHNGAGGILFETGTCAFQKLE